MKVIYTFIFLIFILLPLNFIQAANPYLISDFIQDDNIFVGIFNASGRTIRSFWAGSLQYNNGVNLACGDIDGDNQEEIVTVFNSGFPEVKIFSHEGEAKYADFFVYDKSYYGGVNLTLGDLDGDDKKEIIVAPLEGNLPVKIFDFQGNIMGSTFYPFSKNYRGSISLAAGDIDLDDKEEIIIGSGQGSETEVKLFDISGSEYPINFYPFGKQYKEGISLAAGDIEGDGKNEILMCQKNKGSWCKIYNYSKQKEILYQWHAFANFSSGVAVNMADIDRDGKDEIITSNRAEGKKYTRAFKNGQRLNSLFNFSISGSSLGNSDIDIFFDSKKDKEKVTYVDDGDTVFLNNNLEIRYIGINTPEIDEDYYVEATNRNEDLVFEKEVELEYDKQKIDPYGRLLAYVYLDGEMINAKLLEEGLARIKTFPPNEKYLDLLKEKENLAKEKKIGIWSKEKEGKKFSFWDLFGFFKIFF